MPGTDAWFKLLAQGIFRGDISHTPTLAWHDAKPWVDVMPPCTRHRCAVHDHARMMGSPLPNGLPLRRPAMVTHERKEADAFVNVGMQDGQTGQAFPLPLPFRPVPIDLASTGVQGRHEREGPGACRRRRVPVGHRLWLGWEGGGETWSGLQGRLLVHGEDHLIRSQRTGLAVDQLHPRGIDGGVSGLLRMEPPLMVPGLQVMASQKPPHRGGSDVLHAPLGAALVRQFGAIPRRQATAQRIRALAGQTHHVERHLWGKTPLGSAARGIRQTIQALGENPLGPRAHHRPLHADHRRHGGVGVPCRQPEAHLPAACPPSGHGGRPLPALQGWARVGGHDNTPRGLPATCHRDLLPVTGYGLSKKSWHPPSPSSQMA